MSQDRKPDFEKQMQRLQKIVESLESGELSLEKGVALYREGLAVAASCKRKLAEARHDVTLQDGETLRSFEDGGENGGENGGEDGGEACGDDDGDGV
jgi:exodeoxyribonuclease VII small subunit